MDYTVFVDKPAVYQIKNTVTGDLYVGSSIYMRRRIRQHIYHLERKTHANRRLQNAFLKYGRESFSVSILEDGFTREKISIVEQKHMDTLKPEYNILENAYTHLGSVRREETKAKIGASHKGMKHTEEAKAKMSKSLKGKKKPPRTEEHKNKLAEAMRNRIFTAEHKANFLLAMAKRRGSKLPDEVKKKMSEAQKRIPLDVRERMNQANRDRGISAEGLARISEASRNRIVSDKTRRKLSESKKGSKLSQETIAKRQATRRLNMLMKIDNLKQGEIVPDNVEFEDEQSRISNSAPTLAPGANLP